MIKLDRMLNRGMSLSGRERNCLYMNLGKRAGFANVSAVSGFDFIDDARGISPVDWDFDGDLDLWIANRTAPQVRFLRNDNPRQPNNWLQLKLQGNGTTTNRDAIGARVEVVPTRSEGSALGIRNSKLIKTVRAGEGFISQHSKWQHFGLGSAVSITSVLVRWPGGEAETFAGVQPNAHYKLVQGTAQAALWQPPQDVVFEASTTKLPEAGDKAAVFLVNPVPLPLVSWQPFDDDAPRELAVSGPTLVNLWASWCAPCVGELKAFETGWESLQAAGVNVIALSVDGLGDDRGTSEAARQLVKRLGLTFDAGMANQRLLLILDLIIGRTLSAQDSLVVPTSVLLDADRRVAAIYKGPVTVERVLEDVTFLEADAQDRRDRMMPFAGSWAFPAKLLELWNLAARFRGSDDLSSAVYYLSLMVDDWEAAVEQGVPPQEHRLPLALAETAALLFVAERYEEAAELGRQSIAFDPDLQLAHYFLAKTLLLQRRPAAAAVHFRETLRLQAGNLDDPVEMLPSRILKTDHVYTLLSLAQIQGNAGELDEAEELLRRAATLDPENLSLHFDLARLLARRGDDSGAVQVYRRILEFAPEQPSILNNLASILATHWDANLRDGEAAIALAEKACELTAWTQPIIVDTLAAAYAEAGRFDKALVTAKRALHSAKGTDQPEFAKYIRTCIALYETGKPYHLAKPEGR